MKMLRGMKFYFLKVMESEILYFLPAPHQPPALPKLLPKYFILIWKKIWEKYYAYTLWF